MARPPKNQPEGARSSLQFIAKLADVQLKMGEGESKDQYGTTKAGRPGEIRLVLSLPQPTPPKPPVKGWNISNRPRPEVPAQDEGESEKDYKKRIQHDRNQQQQFDSETLIYERDTAAYQRAMQQHYPKLAGWGQMLGIIGIFGHTTFDVQLTPQSTDILPGLSFSQEQLPAPAPAIVGDDTAAGPPPD